MRVRAYQTDLDEIVKTRIEYQGYCEGWFTSANKPYEVVTTCVLLRAFMLGPDACQIQ